MVTRERGGIACQHIQYHGASHSPSISLHTSLIFLPHSLSSHRSRGGDTMTARKEALLTREEVVAPYRGSTTGLLPHRRRCRIRLSLTHELPYPASLSPPPPDLSSPRSPWSDSSSPRSSWPGPPSRGRCGATATGGGRGSRRRQQATGDGQRLQFPTASRGDGQRW